MRTDDTCSAASPAPRSRTLPPTDVNRSGPNPKWALNDSTIHTDRVQGPSLASFSRRVSSCVVVRRQRPPGMHLSAFAYMPCSAPLLRRGPTPLLLLPERGSQKRTTCRAIRPLKRRRAHSLALQAQASGPPESAPGVDTQSSAGPAMSGTGKTGFLAPLARSRAVIARLIQAPFIALFALAVPLGVWRFVAATATAIAKAASSFASALVAAALGRRGRDDSARFRRASEEQGGRQSRRQQKLEAEQEQQRQLHALEARAHRDLSQKLDDVRDAACATLDEARGLSSSEFTNLPAAARRRLLAAALEEARNAAEAASALPSSTSSTSMAAGDMQPIDVWRSADALRPATADSLRRATAPASVRGAFPPNSDRGARGRKGSEPKNEADKSGRNQDDPPNVPWSPWSQALTRYWVFAEKVNTRAAALGFLLCLARETLEPGHPTLFDQIGDVLVPIAQVTPPFVIAMCDRIIDLVL